MSDMTINLRMSVTLKNYERKLVVDYEHKFCLVIMILLVLNVITRALAFTMF